jgi:autotransporter-associated beta strand protein
MKKVLLIGLCMVFFVGGLRWWHYSQSPREVAPRATAASSSSTETDTNLPPVLAKAAPAPSVSREMDLTVNPYASGLREPGKSKRGWDADYIKSFQQAKNSDPVRFELTGGVMAEGSVKITQIKDGQVTYVSGVLTAPEPGKFFFLTPPVGGKAGTAVGVVEFPASKTAYRIEPTGPNGAPELWQRRLDEVICLDMPEAAPAVVPAAARTATNQTENLVPLRPDQVADYVPSYNSNIVSLQSYPGSPAVLLLDFFGGSTAYWGGVTYTRPPVDNKTIKDIWKRVAEDYLPFNINVTTDTKVYQAAAQGSRMRCCFTTTPVTAAGVAYEGSWNWGGDIMCWSVYYVGKPAAEVAAHEPGHTLGLSHETQDIPSNGTNIHNEYFTGQGSGATGWCPIMGAAYYQPVTTFAHGEYLYAGNLEDQLHTIATANNNVTYRADDTGDTLATSRYLEIYTNNAAFAEGVIERTADTDAFQFTTTGGAVTLTANPVGDWSDLAMMATLADATDTIIASNNLQTVLSATIATNLPAGTYTFRVTGAGRNDPVTNGFSNYSSLGYYSITGSVAGARQPTRLSVVEHATNNTVVGTVPAINTNGSPWGYAIVSGNTGGTFSVDNSGVVTVANNLLLDYYKLATNTAMYGVQFELFMNITNVNNPSLTELNRRVVIAVQKLYPPVPTALTAVADTCLRIDLVWMGGQEATSYNVKRATTSGGPYTTVASPSGTSYTDGGLTNGITYYYVVSAVNTNGESTNSAEASAMAQAVADFGFEIPGIGSGNYSYNPGGGFWTFSGAAGSGSGIVANGSGFSNPNAPEGTQAAFLQKYGTITQTLSGFVPGKSYTITYSAAQRSGSSQNGGESWNVVIDGNVIKANSPGATSFTTYTAMFTATAATHTLAFVGTDLVGGDNTVFIDNVRFISPALQPVAAAVALTSPADKSALAAYAPVNLTATVTPNGNIINYVQFYADNITLLGQITNAPYTLAWVNASPGWHTVYARVFFNSGSSADSSPVSFAVTSRNPDYGFETPSLGSGNYAYTPAGAIWTFSSDFNGDSGSGIAANGSVFGNPNAPQGTQAALLQSYSSISQTLTGFAPGTNYTITYSAAQRSGTAQHGGESWNVVIDNTVIKANNPGSTSFTTYTANFTATAVAHTLAFVGTDLVGGDNTVFIDNVSITPPLSTIPTPDLTTNTLPVTAADVVGSQVAFLAAFNSTNPVACQWQKIVGGLLSDIAGATNPVMTLTNLQLSDTASYRLQASNAWGVSVSTASPLTVSNVPAASNNVIVAYAAQTGLGSTAMNFVPTWTLAPGSLIAGQSPSSMGSGSFSQNIGFLTDGTFGFFNFIPGVGLSPTEVTCGPSAGQSVTYILGSAASGYNISNIVVYGGWGDAGRDQQAYTVYYSTVAAPTNFLWLASANYDPANPSAVQSATRATFSSSTAAPLVTNVAAVKFDFTTPAGENGYSGYSEIAVYGTSINPAATLHTLPVTAADVVGSQVTFKAAFTGVGPLSYQWQKVSGGVTNNVAGATNTMLTLTNLQLANTASYQLQASNAYGVAVSTPSALTVSSVPAAVNNVVTSVAAQTGTGSGTFTPTWTVTTNNSLIAGQSPSSASGSFTLEVPGRSVSSLTDGGDGALTTISGTSGTTTSINYVTCGNGGGAGSLVVYTLTGFAAGYNLTNITVYGGWADNGRDQQAYTVYYSKVTAPATFYLLGTVNYNPANAAGAQSATRISLSPAAGVLATNVAAVKFDFTTPTSENGYCGYTEILLSGVPSSQPVKWAVGNGNWDTSTLNWKSLVSGGTTGYLENNLAALDDSATGTSPITVTLTGDHSPGVLTNNSTKNYILAGGFSITNGSLVKNGTGTLILDNGGANNFSGIRINSGTVQVGNSDANGSLGAGKVTNNGTLAFNRTDLFNWGNPVSGSGSMVQNGSGTLALSAADTYAGSTLVNAGTLALVGSGSINASALIAVANGAILDVTGRNDQTLTLGSGETLKGSGSVQGQLTALTGSIINPGDLIGTLRVQGNITLNGVLLMELNRTNGQASDQLISAIGNIAAAGILTVTNLGPALQAGDVFSLFNQPVSGFTTVNLPDVGSNVWANNLANNGTLAVVSTAAPNLTTRLAIGNFLTLTWPADHTGWRLQVQTNIMTQGLGTNWVDVPEAATTNQLSIPINSTNGSVFYRLLF